MIALSVLFIFGILLMLAGGLGIARIAIREKKRADHNDELQKFWYDKWFVEVERNIELNDGCLVLLEDKQTLEDNLAKLEQGTIEIEENYQQELLDEYDKVQQLNGKADYYHNMTCALEQIRLDHEVFCLPDLTSGELITDTSLDDEDPPIYSSVVFEHIG